jgi:adenylate cyclase
MNRPRAGKKFGDRLVGGILGALLTVLVGMVGLHVGDGLARLSYDLVICGQNEKYNTPSDLVMVYLDDSVKKNLAQPADQPLDRHFYTELLNRLTDDGARLVLFDIIFDQPHPQPSVDEAFAAAMRRNGRVILIADYIKELNGNVLVESPLPAIPLLNNAAAAWGLAKVSPDEGDWAIRRLDTGVEDYPSASWAAATVLAAPATKETRLAPRWLNYYCFPGDFRNVPLDHALTTNGLPAGYFRDKIVVVGARPLVGIAGAGREEFPNPWTRFGYGNSTGPSVHALSLLNLLRGDWLVRMKFSTELEVVILWGIFVTVLFLKFHPWLAVVTALICGVCFAFVAAWIQLHQHIWFSWMVPAALQTPVALTWAVGYQYLVETRRRKQLRRAFGAYLSPYMADQIAEREFDLALGGREIEASVMFTDLEGFTKMSETLPPAEVSKILTGYFNHATRGILEEDGTIIKYIGDAVLAVWGAPLPDKRHAQRAVLAAWGMSQAGKEEIHGRRLRTRIGVNTGMMLAGNLGSDFRFDYTVIGDTVNFAARLEGLNKHLGTDVLISEFTARQLDDSIKLRALGRFIVSGKEKAIGIFEVFGLAKDFPHDPPWLTFFNRALEHFVKRELDAAENLMREVIAMRGGQDGPAEFYLQVIARARELKADAPWDGTVKFDAK